MTDMTGKTAIVTGATRGLGVGIAQGLAGMGAETIIISRSEQKCKDTVAQIQQETGNENVRYYAADLSVMAQVRDVAAQLNRDLDRLDVLVNNAGAWFTERKLSAEGIEMTWALDHLNYFLLTHDLLDLLKRTAATHGDARIINQSSLANHEGKLHRDNIQFDGTWNTDGRGSFGPGWGAYSQAKYANVVHAKKLARLLDGTGVVANAVHPGTVVTGFSQNNGLMYRIAAPFRRLWNPATIADGAAPAVYLASAPEAATITGKYYGPPTKEEPSNPTADSIEEQDWLWQHSMELVGLAEPA
ncbi:MAG: SDR family NAD(P)-dependent oxidoreductase [Chloroflexota bacterium]